LSESEEESSEELLSSTEDQSESEQENSQRRRTPSFSQTYNVNEVNLDFVELKQEFSSPSSSSIEKHVLESTDQENKPVSRGIKIDLVKAN
jgi:hypothetical protein